MTQAVKLSEILEKTTAFFKGKDFDSPRLDAELLLAKALGLRRIDLYLKYDQPLAEPELEKCRDSVRRRAVGEPVAYILGEKEFYGLVFNVNSSVLIPRPETELLVEEILNYCKQQGKESGDLKILDLGCGSGCIGLSLLHNLKNSTADFVDISSAAIEVAKNNAQKLNVNERSNFICADAGNLSLQKNKYDIVVANPPYISKSDLRIQEDVKNFEPHQALFSAEEGLADLFQWSKNATPAMNENAIMGFEFGVDQSEKVQQHFQNLKSFSNFKIVKDFSGIDRHVIAIRKGL